MPDDPLSTTFAALADATRRAILARLISGECSVTELARPFDMSLPAVSKHLHVLERAGLISREKQGREVLISFRPEPLRLVSGWVHEYERFWSEHLDQFEEHFKNERKKS